MKKYFLGIAIILCLTSCSDVTGVKLQLDKLDITNNVYVDNIVTPLGTDVYNNGGNIIQYGDCIYYYKAVENNSLDYELTAMKIDGSEESKIFEIYSPEKLFVVDNFIITSGNIDNNISVVKINVETGEVIDLFSGRLKHVDTENKDIYYYSFGHEKETGLYKTGLSGEDSIKLLSENEYFIEKIDDTIYFETHTKENDNFITTLYSINSDASNLTEIAKIVPEETEDSFFENQYIVDFGICDDWIILSAGKYQGSAHIFYGDLYRMRKDGSEFEALNMLNIENFEIYNNKIYFCLYNQETDISSFIQTSPDFTDKTYLDENIDYLYKVEDGYIYYMHMNLSETFLRNDLRKTEINKNGYTTLYSGHEAPVYEDSNYIDYDNIDIVGDYIYFPMKVSGYKENDNWRGHICYEGYFRIHKDGGNIELLYELENPDCLKVENTDI